ncbi:hypothetical protein [Acinetobacter sp.]|uniref:hypothetical protein n=1 Tax=Acinetobacter sp. TaxID=472 RepID=UPI00264945FB|nr:hypothetical protein [Acinetobacter sp.]MDN5511170.1 hypothetical protein [Acinetobacter sp.]MDN5523937.1 hypothetical protein [Acinetobacter sp.]
MPELNRLAYCVQQSGYTVNFGNDVIAQNLDGGPSRYRRDIRRNSHLVSVSWVVKLRGYQYLTAFHRVWMRNPSQPFLAKLIIDDELKDYECFFKSAIQLNSKNGPVYQVSAQLEVKALIADDVFDELLVEVGNQSIDLGELMDPLEELVNVDLPNALENVNV